MPNNEEYVVLGRIGAPFGILGFVHIQTFTEEPDSIFGYSPWFLKTAAGWKPFEVQEFRPHRNSYVVKLSHCDDRDKAARLTNLEIGILKSDLPALEAGDFYWSDLVGLTVLNEDNIQLGTVSHLFGTGANDVLVVVGGEKEHLIPYIPQEYIKEVDIDKRVIRVHWDPLF